MDWKLIRARLQAMMDARGTNPTQLANLSGGRVTQPTIYRFLQGQTKSMKIETLVVVAELLDSSIDELQNRNPVELDSKIRRVMKLMQSLPEYKKDAIVSTAEAMTRAPGPDSAKDRD